VQINYPSPTSFQGVEKAHQGGVKWQIYHGLSSSRENHLIKAKLPTLIIVMLHKPKKIGTNYVEVFEQNVRIKHNSSVNLTALKKIMKGLPGWRTKVRKVS